MSKTHYRAFSHHACVANYVYEVDRPLCGADPIDPGYSEEPTCKRCQRMVPEPCATCGDTGYVYWDATSALTGDHVPMRAPCPDCNEDSR